MLIERVKMLLKYAKIQLNFYCFFVYLRYKKSGNLSDEHHERTSIRSIKEC